MSDGRVLRLTKSVIDSLAVPVTVKFTGGGSFTVEEGKELEFVSSLIRKTSVSRRWTKRISIRVKKFCADVERLMYVAEVVSGG